MNRAIRVIVADDHPIFLLGLKAILSTEKTIQVVGEAPNGEIALDLIRELRPDFAILDVEMPKMSGFQVAEALFEAKSETKIIFLTMYRDEGMFNRAFDIGVQGYVLKENASTDILMAISMLKEGKYFISALISDFLVNRAIAKTITPLGWEGDKLSPAELKIVQQLSLNKTNKEIADELFLSPKTVENHRNSICKKLGLSGSFALKGWVAENRIKLQDK